MKLSQYAKQQGISYKTAWRWYKAGQLDAYQTVTGTIVVENRDRLTSFGVHYIETLLHAQGRHLELLFAGDTSDELVDDFVAVITSMAARIYGRRASKRRAEKIKACVEQAMQQDEEKGL